jgi:hypothetical protein
MSEDENGNGDNIVAKLATSKIGISVIVALFSIILSYFSWLGYSINQISYVLIKHGDKIDSIEKDLSTNISNTEKKFINEDSQIGTVVNVENTLASELAALKAAMHQQEIDIEFNKTYGPKKD